MVNPECPETKELGIDLIGSSELRLVYRGASHQGDCHSDSIKAGDDSPLTFQGHFYQLIRARGDRMFYA